MQKMLALTGNRNAGKSEKMKARTLIDASVQSSDKNFASGGPISGVRHVTHILIAFQVVEIFVFGVYEGLAVKAGSDKVQPQAARCGICVSRSGPVCVACELDQSACFERSRTCVAALRTIQPLKISFDPDAEKWLVSFK